MSRELNKIFDVKSRQARRDILDKFDLSKEDKNKILNKIDSGGDSDSGSGNGSVSKIEFVDLGLSVNWATCNIGATKPEEVGLYFAWGEIEGVKTPTEFDLLLNNYKWYDAETEQYSKYNSTDGLSTLELEDDCAYQTYDKMRMPTVHECQELLDNVSRVFVTNYKGSGISGAVLTSTRNGNSIFIPASMSNGEDSVIWSKSLNNDSTAYCLNVDIYAGLTHDIIRYIEIPVRPVQDK